MVLAIIGMFLFKHYYEILFASAIMYALYAIPNRDVISSEMWFPVIISSVFILIEILKSSMIIYKNEI